MGILTLLLPLLGTIVESVFPDKKKQDEVKLQMTQMALVAQAEEMKAKGNIIVAEAKSESWLPRNIRPLAFATFLFIVFNNYILVNYLAAVGVMVPALPIPPDMWTAIWVCLGGYIGSRGVEKSLKIKAQQQQIEFDRKAFFDSIKDSEGILLQEKVDNLTKAINKGLKV